MKLRSDFNGFFFSENQRRESLLISLYLQIVYRIHRKNGILKPKILWRLKNFQFSVGEQDAFYGFAHCKKLFPGYNEEKKQHCTQLQLVFSNCVWSHIQRKWIAKELWYYYYFLCLSASKERSVHWKWSFEVECSMICSK